MHTSYWIETSTFPAYPRLDRDLMADVAIVGGGITGITAALMLARAGKKVAVLEGRRVAQGVTGFTTAHLTEAIDTRFVTLRRDFGKEGAHLAAQASRVAIDLIESLVREKAIDCGFRRLPGFLYTERDEDLESLHEEHHAAQEAGVECEMTRSVPLPFPTAGGIVFPNQAEVHIRDYLRPLCDEITSLGGLVFEESRVHDVEDGRPCKVVTDHGTVRAGHVIVAANVPLNRVFLQTKISHYRSYALAAKVTEPRIEGLFWDTDDPYHYLRSAGDVVIVGGEDHKTGTENHTQERYDALLDYTKKRFSVQEVVSSWSAQVIETVDGLPYIGRNSMDTRVFVATGYSGNGVTFGTAAAILLSDLVLAKANPWRDLFEPTRVKPIASVKDFVSHNTEAGLHFVGDRFRAPDAKSVDDVKPGEGKIVLVDGKRLACYREPTGALHALSPVCPHLGCHVRFNDAEKSWDCPCHGSRFTTDGEVINGPSMRGLSPVDVTSGEKRKAG